MKDFTYIGRPARVVFGAGKLRELPAEVERLGARKALVLSTPERRAAAEQVAALLGPRAAGVFDKATMHVPIATAREACEYAARIGADTREFRQCSPRPPRSGVSWWRHQAGLAECLP